MATSQTYNGDGSTTAFAFTVPYINTTDVKAQIGGVATTAFSVSGTTVTFNTAPASGTNNVKIYRETNNTTIEANFQSGSALRAVDFNDNFTQVLYVTQEATETSDDAFAEAAVASTNATNAAASATSAQTSATAAQTSATAAQTSATAAASDASTASTNATNAVNTANTANSTANTASTNASAAVTTANAASATATTALNNSRESDGSGGFNTAISVANTASTNASNAVSTANTASTNASNAVTTANNADSNATTALNNSRESDGSGGYTSAISKANTALTNASSAQTAATNAATSATSAQTSATSAQTSATAAAASAAASENVADAFTATGTPATALTVDVPIDAANGVKLPTNANSYDQEGAIRYNTTLDKIEIRKGSGWNTAAGGATVSSTAPTLASSGDVWYDHDNGRAYVYYNDGDSNQWVEMNPSWNGYVSDNSVTSAKIVDGTIVNADINASAAIGLSKLATGALPSGITVASTNITDGTIVNADINASAAIAGTKIDPDFGSQYITVDNGYGLTTVGGLKYIADSDDNAPATGAIHNFYTDNGSTSALAIQKNGNIGVGITSPTGLLHISGQDTVVKIQTSAGSLSDMTNNTSQRIGFQGGNAEIGLFKDSGANYSYVIGTYQGSTDIPLVFRTGSRVERMRIDSSGNIGVGISAPSAKLHIAETGGNAKIFIQRTNAAANTNDYGSIIWRSTGNNNNGMIGVARESAENDGYMFFSTASGGSLSERMRIDSAGRLLAGTTTPGYVGADELTLHSNGGTGMTIRSTSTTNGTIYFADGTSGSEQYQGIIQYRHSDDALQFYTNYAGNSAPRVSINSSGLLLIGCNSFATNVPGVSIYNSGGNRGRINVVKTFSGNADGMACFHSGNYVGGIIYSNTGTSIAGQSDYRLKENVVKLENPIERVKKLLPKRFNFIAEPGTTLDGFIAHEVQEVVPEAVFGEKDDEERMQALDQSKLVPLLTAALQEAIAKIETLETKVAQLETYHD